MDAITCQPEFMLSAAPTGRTVFLALNGEAWGAIVDSDIAGDPGALGAATDLKNLGATRIIVAHARPATYGDRPVLTWTRASVEAFQAACRRWLDAIAPGATLLLWPRADQLVSDIPSGLSLLRAFEGERLGLVLDPDAMITASMLAHRADYLDRFADALASHASTALVMDRGGLPATFASHLPRLRQPQPPRHGHGA
ncbi:MAG: hypothetical protein JNL50_06995 [Phycisphaerae bacterium]|nr:hypothetical protein [Phycisphaerae bacterium]